VSATVTGAIVPFRDGVAQRYGNGEASIVYAPLHFLSFQAAFFWNQQTGLTTLNSFQSWGVGLTVVVGKAWRL
jgi:hypothetical protein